MPSHPAAVALDLLLRANNNSSKVKGVFDRLPAGVGAKRKTFEFTCPFKNLR